MYHFDALTQYSGCGGAPKWPKISYFGHFERFCPPRYSWNIPYSDKNDRSYVQNPWYRVEKGVNGVWKGFERKKIDFFHFWAIFLYILSENPYILESQLPTISSFQKNLKKFWKFFLMEWDLGTPLLERFGKMMVFWDTLKLNPKEVNILVEQSFG